MARCQFSGGPYRDLYLERDTLDIDLPHLLPHICHPSRRAGLFGFAFLSANLFSASSRCGGHFASRPYVLLAGSVKCERLIHEQSARFFVALDSPEGLQYESCFDDYPLQKPRLEGLGLAVLRPHSIPVDIPSL